MADWFIATEGVKVVKDSTSLWPQIITAVSSIGAALGGVSLTHRFTRRREERAAADKTAAERLYIVTELVFSLERYASAWRYVRWHSLYEFLKENSIPTLDLSGASGDWRVLPSRLIFRIRSLEAEQAALVLHIEQMDSPTDLREQQTLYLECVQAGLKAFLLAAKLRREAGLPDSAQLSGKSGTFMQLLNKRRQHWGAAIIQRETDREVSELTRSFNSQFENNKGRKE
ncbi:hypothetical protein CD006_26485 [Enterobacter sp. 10-1]|uniref:hypothetical protein n=1 Tax=Raoultella sp. 10-1 TaxID=2683201 RepID=UPI000BA3F6F4|nr:MULTISPECIES: hypothetical protein [Enterobacteriaceae]MVT06084.1 hypothetical protein [Raoultella sp. 10-1]PAC07342.1 hypothetical protein CD006_26485 [Enterobacter sp. 10-1]